ncbi:hypothetical protein JDS87_25875 [Bacillus cereus]|nr:hypothetical protein [Bacillus cereus]
MLKKKKAAIQELTAYRYYVEILGFYSDKLKEQLAKANCSALREREKENYRGHCEFKLYQPIYSIGHNLEFYSDKLKKSS